MGSSEVHDRGASESVRAALDRGRISTKVGLSVLGKLGDARALSSALERLTVADAETRAAAMDAADVLLSPKDADGRAVEPLARALAARTVSRPERLRLVSLLGRTGSERALSTLLPLLDSTSDAALAESAAAALGNVPGDAAGRALLVALRSDEVRVRQAAALSIRKGQHAQLAAPLLQLLEQGGQAERALSYLALPGPLAACNDDRLLTRAAALLERTLGSERDELLEALAASSRKPARAALLRLATSSDYADRAKLAELLSAHPDLAALLRLVRDPDRRVRASAAWSLGFVDPSAAPAAREQLLGALKDREPAVAGNAAVSLGRLARDRTELGRALCGQLLQDPRATVREQALRGLALARASCGEGVVRASLTQDPRARVRRAAAEALLRAQPDAADRRALSSCQDNDTQAQVAETCAGNARPDIAEIEPTTVLIVPSPGAPAAPGAAFALLWADGSLRLGSADRRGGVHEPRAPKGGVELLPYAGGD